jgi:zinc/manganese transport system substrate-binding protein
MFYNKLFGCFALICVSTGVAFATPVTVVSISDDFASIAQSIGGNHVNVISLIKGARNLHSITPKPSMVMHLKKADLLIRLGMDQDSWIDGLIHVAKNSRLFPGQQGYIDASKNIQKLEVPQGSIDGSMGDVHLHGNPHYWLNPENGLVIAKQIKDQLILIDPDHSADYQANYQDFSKRLSAKILQWKQALVLYKDYNFVTYHKSWSYFFDAFNLNKVGDLEALPGIAPTTSHLVALSNTLKQSKQPAIVLTTLFYPKKVSERFAKKHDATFLFLSSNVGSAGVTSYINLFDYLVDSITQ